MDLEKSWHEAGSALSKVFLAILTIAAALSAGISASDRPSDAELVAAQERLERLSILEAFVGSVVPVEDHVPSPENFPLSWDRDQSIAGFSKIATVSSTIQTILAVMKPMAQQAIDSGSANRWFHELPQCGTLMNFDSVDPATFGDAFVRATNNLNRIQAQLEAAGVAGQPAQDLTIAQLVLSQELIGDKFFAIRAIADAIPQSTALDPWYCEGAPDLVQYAGDWDMNKAEDQLSWAVDSGDVEIVLLAKSHARDLAATREKFERERRDLLSTYVSEPTLRIIDFLPPVGFKLGVALFPGLISTALIAAIGQVLVLVNNMRLPDPKIPLGKWQQRVSGYFVFPLPKQAGGTIVETLVSTACWACLPILSIILHSLAIIRYTLGDIQVEDFHYELISSFRRISDLANDADVHVPPLFEYQTLFVFSLYVAIALTVALQILCAIARGRADRLPTKIAMMSKISTPES